MLPRLALPPSHAVLRPDRAGVRRAGPGRARPLARVRRHRASRSCTRCTSRATGSCRASRASPGWTTRRSTTGSRSPSPRPSAGCSASITRCASRAALAMLAALWFLYLAARHSALPMSPRALRRRRAAVRRGAARPHAAADRLARPDGARARGGARPRRAGGVLRRVRPADDVRARNPYKAGVGLRRGARRRVPVHRPGGARGAGRRRAARAPRLRRMAHARARRAFSARPRSPSRPSRRPGRSRSTCARPSSRRPGGTPPRTRAANSCANLRYYLTTASWFAWPAWPLAAWAAWTCAGEWRTPRVFVPLAAALLALLGDRLGGPAAGHQHHGAARRRSRCWARTAWRGCAAARPTRSTGSA